MTTAAARPCRFRLEGLTISGRRWDGEGMPVVLLHGLASTSRIFDLVAPRLAGRFPVLAYDQRGHGRSGKPPSGYGFTAVTADLMRVARAAGFERFVVAGHSWGAHVALAAAAARPRVIAGLLMIDGGLVRIGDHMPWAEARVRLAPPSFDGMTLEEILEMVRAEPGIAELWSPAVREIVLSLFHTQNGRVRARLSREAHMRILRALWAQPIPALLGRLSMPAGALLARSPGDPFGRPKRDAARAARRAGVAVRWIDGIHDLPVQHPGAVAAEIAGIARAAR